MVQNIEFVNLILFLTLVNHAIAVKENTCKDGYFLNYTLPMFEMCSEREHPEFGMQKTIPKLVPFPTAAPACAGRLNERRISSGLRVCKFPDCIRNPCVNGWCEESISSFVCHCAAEFTGRNCETSLLIGPELPDQSTIMSKPNEAPLVLSCPQNINQSVELGSLGSVVHWIPPNAINASGIPTIVANVNLSGIPTTIHDIDTGSFFNYTNDTVQVVYRFTDEDGRIDALCSFNISFYYVDSTPPDVVCSEDLYMDIELGTPNVSVPFPEPSASDISGKVYLVTNYLPGDFFPVGSTLVEYVFVDESGNNATCNFSVIIETVDTTPPVVQSCPSNQISSVPLGKTNGFFTWTPPTGTDAAGIASVNSNHQPGVNISIGTNITVSYNVTDNTGLTNTSCSFNLSVVSVAPEWKCSFPKCYQKFGQKSWSDAQKFCSSLAAVSTLEGDRSPSLLFADSVAEFNKIHELFGTNNGIAWINCNDQVTEGTFICDVGGAGMGHHDGFWQPSEPNGGTIENCVAMGYQATAQWVDTQCSQHHFTVCQLMISPSGQSGH